MATSEKKQLPKQTDVENNDMPHARSLIHFFRRAFPDAELEKLYLSYSVKQKREGVLVFLNAAILYDIFNMVSPYDSIILRIVVHGVFLFINILLAIFCKYCEGVCSLLWSAIPHIVWHVSNAQLLLYLFLKDNVTGRDNLGWAVLLDFLLYVLLPLRLRYCVLLSLATCTAYLMCLTLLVRFPLHLAEQICANGLLLLATNILGLTSYLLADKQQRRAFLETRQSLEMKMLIEEQSAEQERLLLSVLPEHVAVKMRQDMGTALDSQFKKIYMSRHENVSILYADIVGFTAISSTYSASELVKILNELFARFDRLSERYQQLRIKILGDCYYCISGAPRERPDHAVLCVHMGLSMVKAIKYVQQTCNSPVDMRVGIHTGAVLAGVLGQRQWQFDVYSKDVELANKMESSGKPGRVHISEKTFSFLNGEFEVEPAFGEKREEALRMAGIKTYFIVKVLKPFKATKQENQNGNVAEGTTSTGKDDDDDDDDFGCSSPQEEENQMLPTDKKDGADFKSRLRMELVNKGGLRDLESHVTRFTLSFRDEKKEKDFHHNKETAATISILGCPLVLFFISISQFIVLPRDELSILSFTGGVALLALISILAVGELLPTVFPKIIVQSSTFLNDTLWTRRLLAAAAVIVLGIVNAVDMISCDTSTSHTTNCTDIHIEEIGSSCIFPSYFTYFCVLVLVAASLPTQLSHLVKSTIFLFVASVHWVMNLLVIDSSLDCEESIHINKSSHCSSLTNGKYLLCFLLALVVFALAYLARHVEKSTRVLFQWKTEVEEQRERASDMGRRNEALVYNILPPHVAVHFLGSRKRQHEELYSQSYAEVGVLFASMPNFSDFYSEESVNNQGLECLRFLNEVISDFDALLQQQQFQDIIKIKTIGSTYMAASGLNPSKNVKPDDPLTVKWAHLALLVEFAFELKKALQGINEQSFNHFVLKMGINHGPITAGVIGARKPHYDIWGNSVNVASRMESTGKAGCIQVTEETCKILQNYGYIFEQRGLVAVKGKGQLMTYYLIGKGDNPTVQPTGMETVKEEPETNEEDKKRNEKSDVDIGTSETKLLADKG